jgi:hypothetical protein
MEAPVVTIAGSYQKHALRIIASAERFRALGATVLRPAATEVVSGENDYVLLEGDPSDIGQVHRLQFEAIDETARRGGLVYVVNPGGYVGSGAVANVAWGARAGAIVICQEPAYEDVVAELEHGHSDSQTRSEEWALGMLKELRGL